ncbi:MAG: thioredoxin domain-containing protein [Myxococcota bacterium]
MSRSLLAVTALGLLCAAAPPTRAHEGHAPDEAHARYRVVVPPAADSRGNHVDPLLTLVLFSDLQCPYCARLLPVLDRLEARYPGDLRIVFRHFPLPFHAEAARAARATVCAARQERFWPMHDRIFARQSDLAGADFSVWAGELGADPEAFRECMRDPASAAAVEDDKAAARELEVRGTPTTFINGVKLVGAHPAEDFEALCDEELARARARLGAGVPRAQIYEDAVRDGLIREPLAPLALPVRTAGSPRLGPQRAAVEVVVFSDFECPYCEIAARDLREYQATDPERIAVVFKQLPLPQHEDALAAARAAICAGEQSKFWPMHDALFAAQARLSSAPWTALVAQLGLDRRAFDACMSSRRPDDRVGADIDDADALGVTATPSVYMNGRRLISGGTEPATLERIARRYLADTPNGRGRNGKARAAGP